MGMAQKMRGRGRSSSHGRGRDNSKNSRQQDIESLAAQFQFTTNAQSFGRVVQSSNCQCLPMTSAVVATTGGVDTIEEALSAQAAATATQANVQPGILAQSANGETRPTSIVGISFAPPPPRLLMPTMEKQDQHPLWALAILVEEVQSLPLKTKFMSLRML